MKNFRVETVLVLNYKKRNDCKIFHSSAKVIVSNSDIDEAFNFIHKNIMRKIKNYVCKDWIALDVIIKHSIKIFDC